MPTKDNNIIKYNQGEKSIKLPFVVYADLECLLEKMRTCQNNPNESPTTEINKHVPSGLFIIYSLFKKKQQKKKYIIMNKKFVIYARKNLIRVIKNIIK